MSGGDAERSRLIHDWNVAEGDFRPAAPPTFDDETLRDGLQSPSVVDPPLAKKQALLDAMEELGIETANLGLPGAGENQRRDILELCRHLTRSKARLRPNVACRTVVGDIEPVRAMMDATGQSILACCFIGSSPIRQYTEGWGIDTLLGHVDASLSYARKHGIPVMFVTEDTTRAHPDDLRKLYGLAIDLGAERLCICDTVGHATPAGVRRLVRFIRELAAEKARPVKLDWHGHRDRNLDLANCMAAVEAGVDQVHGAALGVGERAGNAPMDLILANFALLGWIDRDLRALARYVALASEALGVPIPHNYPIFGHDAFLTGTGVHASAVIKALRKNDVWLADRVYSGVPAGLFGGEQRISVGYMSGKSNASFWLERHGYEPTDALVQHILGAAKAGNHLFTDAELHELVKTFRAQASA
ncbi:MAG TPA: LeuA family protein [Planctomycetota bacterium]|nr:LeuA family protein [Planctomycetota bacterium]